jgi:hypothetical protein
MMRAEGMPLQGQSNKPKLGVEQSENEEQIEE